MTKQKQLRRVALFLILVVVLVIIILGQATSPYRQARKEAIAVSKDISDMTKVDDFYWYTREQSYFTVVGENEQSEKKLVVIPEDGKEAIVIPANKGITAPEAVQKVLDLNETKRIKKIAFGLTNNKPIWEITAQSNEEGLSYYLVDFTNGEIIETVKNV